MKHTSKHISRWQEEFEYFCQTGLSRNGEHLTLGGRMKRYQAKQAVIDLDRLSKPVTVFTELSLTRQARQERIETKLKAIEETVECWEITGASDYLVRFVCEDLSRYEAVTNELLRDRRLGIARIVSHIALRPVARFSGYPTSLLKPQRR